MVRRSSLPVAATLLVLAAPGRARAAPPAGLEAEIAWSGPPECPGEAALRGEVERLLGRPLGRSGDVVRVVGEVTRAEGTAPYVLRIRIAHRRGWVNERRLSGQTCSLVLEAAAVVLALALGADPTAPKPAVSPEASPIAPPAPPPPEEEATAAPPAGASRRAWDVAALAGVDFRSLPAPALGLGLSLAWTEADNRIELRTAAWLPRATDIPAQPAVGGDVSLYTAGLRYCRWLVDGSLVLAPCGGIEGGAMLASATGAVAGAPSGVGRWLAPQLGLLGAFHPTPRFSFSLGVEGLALVFRDVFTITGAGAVFRPPTATFRAMVGAHVRFP